MKKINLFSFSILRNMFVTIEHIISNLDIEGERGIGPLPVYFFVKSD